MAKVSYVNVPDPLKESFYQTLRVGERYNVSRLVKKTAPLSRPRVAQYTAFSFLPSIADLWAGFTDLERDAWTDPAALMGLNGYGLFVADQTARIVRDLPGSATPSLYHQTFVGHAQLDEVGSSMWLQQKHTQFYYILDKIAGKKTMHRPLLINEPPAVPITASINYRCNLTHTTGSDFRIFWLQMRAWAHGNDVYYQPEVELINDNAWHTATVDIPSVIGYPVGYTVNISIFGNVGEVWFDDLSIVHSGQDWAIDPFCERVGIAFDPVFSECADPWVNNSAGPGAFFNRVYIDI